MENFTIWQKALCFGLLLLRSTFAGRLDDVARRKGFHPNAMKAFENRARGVGSEAASKRQYYNNETSSKLAAEALRELTR